MRIEIRGVYYHVTKMIEFSLVETDQHDELPDELIGNGAVAPIYPVNDARDLALMVAQAVSLGRWSSEPALPLW